MERRQQILLWIKETFDKNLEGLSYKAFIFGSQANKVVLGLADIDVGIIAEQQISAIHLSNIYADIEKLPMLYKIDIVNFSEVDEKFESVALKNIEKL